MNCMVYPLTRLQVYTQTLITNKHDPSHFKNLSGFYRGYTILLSRNFFLALGVSNVNLYLLTSIITYPLDVIWTKVTAAGSQVKEIDTFKELKRNTRRINYLGLSSYLANIVLYYPFYTLFGTGGTLILSVPIDVIRRNFIIENMKSESHVSYRQVIKKIVSGRKYGNFYSGFYYYTSLYIIPIQCSFGTNRDYEFSNNLPFKLGIKKSNEI